MQADPVLYFNISTEGLLIDLSGIYVDDSLHCGNDKFLALKDASLKNYESWNRGMDKTKFSGINILSTRYGIDMHQWPYLSQIK